MALIPIGPENFTIGHVYVIVLGLIKGIAGFSLWFAIAAIVWGGILLIGSAGNEEKTKSGKNIIVYAVLGLVVIMLSWVTVSQVLRLVEVNCPYTQPDIDKIVLAIPAGEERLSTLKSFENAVKANYRCTGLTFPAN